MDRSLLSRRFVSLGYRTGVIALISTSFVQVSLPALGNMLFRNEKKNRKMILSTNCTADVEVITVKARTSDSSFPERRWLNLMRFCRRKEILRACK